MKKWSSDALCEQGNLGKISFSHKKLALYIYHRQIHIDRKENIGHVGMVELGRKGVFWFEREASPQIGGLVLIWVEFRGEILRKS